jgi:hypothetical protein
MPVEIPLRNILSAAAPGHLDAVADSLSKLASNSFSKSGGSVSADIKDELTKFQCNKSSETTPDHPLAGEMAEKMQRHQQNNFAGKQGVTSRVSIADGDAGGLIIHTYAEKLDPQNQLSGYWRATWTIGNTNMDAGSTDIAGRVQIHSFSAEEGNAQVKLDKVFANKMIAKTALQNGDEPTLVHAVMKQIQEWEMEILGLLQAMNEGGTGEHLKSIRRVLPITKTKMKWDVVAQRSVKTLKKTAPQAISKVNYGS